MECIWKIRLCCILALIHRFLILKLIASWVFFSTFLVLQESTCDFQTSPDFLLFSASSIHPPKLIFSSLTGSPASLSSIFEMEICKMETCEMVIYGTEIFCLPELHIFSLDLILYWKSIFAHYHTWKLTCLFLRFAFC
jgi:hypothetical protein